MVREIVEMASTSALTSKLGDANGASGNTWVIVLAAGEGSRLRTLTTTELGVAVPKQFCSLNGGLSLLHEALHRAASIAQRRHVCAIVAEQHRRWWDGALASLDDRNTIVQPANRGTANGVLLPLLHIMRRDPEARVVLLPSDHYVHDEAVLAGAVHSALGTIETRDEDIVLLGMVPDRADPELGYIVPGSIDSASTSAVERFVEKPSVAVAQSLIDAGALLNAFIVVARARALLRCYVARLPQIVADLLAVVEADADRPDDPVEARRLYRSLPDIDFSRHIIEESGTTLRVLPVQPCGWCDLGTPKRVAETLGRIPAASRGRATRSLASFAGIVNLAARHAALHQWVD